MTVAISQTVRRKLKQYTTWSRILPRASLQLEKYSLSSRWLILFELRAKRQKVPIGSCWSNFLATRYHEPTNFAEQRLKCGKTTNDLSWLVLVFHQTCLKMAQVFLINLRGKISKANTMPFCFRCSVENCSIPSLILTWTFYFYVFIYLFLLIHKILGTNDVEIIHSCLRIFTVLLI